MSLNFNFFSAYIEKTSLLTIVKKKTKFAVLGENYKTSGGNAFFLTLDISMVILIIQD